MSNEFKDQVKKEVEAEEEARILAGCKRGLHKFRKKLDECKADLKHAQMMYDNFLQLVATDSKTAAERFGSGGGGDYNE